MLNDDIIGCILSKCLTTTIGKCLTINRKWKQIIEIYSWLFDLNFSGMNIKNDSLKYFKNVKQINLSNCYQITDKKRNFISFFINFIEIKFLISIKLTMD